MFDFTIFTSSNIMLSLALMGISGIIYLHIENRNIKKTHIPVMVLIDKMLNVDDDEYNLNTVAKDLSESLDYLSLSCSIIMDRFYLKRLFKKQTIKNSDNKIELFNDRVKTLYNLCNTQKLESNRKLISNAIIGILAIQSKLAVIKFCPDLHKQVHFIDTKNILYIPNTTKELFETMLNLHLIMSELGKDFEVYNEYNSNKMLNDFQHKILNNEI